MSGTDSFRYSLASKLALSTSDIHIWRAWLDLPSIRIRQLERTLSIDELERAARFRFERDRMRFVAGRGLLREILGSYLNLPPYGVCFEYGLHGKPMLQRDRGGAAFHFNLSHSNGLAMYAIARDQEVGVDVECIRPLSDAEQIAERFFSSREYSAFCAVSPGQKLNAFYKCWTRKEAFIKAIGSGLTHPLASFDVSLTPGEPARVLRIDGNRRSAAEWTVMELLPAPGYIAAFAVKGKNLRTNCMDYERFVQADADASNALITD